MLSTPGGASGPDSLRRLNEPRRIEVRAGASGAPEALRLQRTWLEAIEVQDAYRTDDRWWTEEPVARLYYELLLEDGRVVTVFRDEITGSWWEQRY